MATVRSIFEFEWGNAEAEETLHYSVQPQLLDRIIRNVPGR